MSDSSGSILLVDDDDVFRERLARAFRERGLAVTEAADHEQALGAIAAGAPPRYALIDLRLPSGSGLELVRALTERHSGTVVVVLTGYGSIATALEAVRLGAAHYLTKPATADEILSTFTRSADDVAPLTTERVAEDVPSLDRVEWEHINRVLADSGGNVSEAARRLGIHRRSLQRKLAKRPVRR